MMRTWTCDDAGLIYLDDALVGSVDGEGQFAFKDRELAQFIVDALNAAERAKEDWLDLWSVSVGPVGDSILLFDGHEVGRISDLMTEHRIAGIANLGERENARLVALRDGERARA